MWPDRVSNPGPPTYESGALPIALRGPAFVTEKSSLKIISHYSPHLQLFDLNCILNKK